MRLLLSVMLLLFVSFFANSQVNFNAKIDKIKQLKDEKDKIIQFYLLLKNNDTITQSITLSELYHELGKSYYKVKDYNSAIRYTKKAVLIKTYFKKQALKSLNKSRYNLVFLYNITNQKSKRLRVIEEIIDDNGTDKYTFNAKIKDVNFIKNSGDYHKALQKLNLMLFENVDYESVEHEDVLLRIKIINLYAKKHESLDTIFLNKNDLNIVNYHKIKIENEFYSKMSSLKESKLFAMYNNIAVINHAFNKFEVALQYYKKTHAYYKKKNKQYNIGQVNINIANLYAKQQKYEKAAIYYKKVIQSNLNQELIANAYNDLAYFSNTLNVKEKIQHSQMAINLLLKINSKEKNDFKLPNIDVVSSLQNRQDLFVYLLDLSTHYVNAYKENNQLQFLEKAKETLYFIDALISKIRYENNSELSKLFWINKGVNVYVLAVEVCYLLSLPSEAFYFMEKNKALLLQEHIKTMQTKLKIEVPKTILEQEYSLYYKLLDYEKKIELNQNNDSIQKEFIAANKRYLKFINSIKKKYPHYINVKKETKTILLKEAIEKYTDDHSCFVEYIMNEKEGYLLFCTQKESKIYKIKDVPNLKIKIDTLKKIIAKPILTNKNMGMYKELSYSVFKTIFGFKNALEKLEGKKITIIPDYSLLNFPFEALCVDRNKDLKNSYLINYSEISYLQSISLFKDMKNNTKKAKYVFLGVVPYKYEKQNLPELSESKEVIKNLSKIASSKFLLGIDATKQHFLKQGKACEILYLNTHAGIDSITQEPWIAMRNSKIYLHELYGIPLQTKLVVLDACKTNNGKTVMGEGVINLSRSFFYNGTKSVMASLWNVNEKSGNKIVTGFFDNIKKGNTKSKALQKAKHKYLKTHQNSEISPYYWASFVLTGNNSAIQISDVSYKPIIIVGGIIIVLLLLYLLKFQKIKS